MLVNDTTIYVQHSEVVVNQETLNACTRLNGIILNGYLPVTSLLSENRIANFEKLLGYGSLFDLTKGYLLQLADSNTIIMSLFVGKIAIPFAAYQGEIGSSWQALAGMNLTISATYSSATHQLFFVNDPVAINQYGIKRTRDKFLLSKLQNDSSQVFQVYPGNRPLTKEITDDNIVEIPINSALRDKFGDAGNASQLDDLVENNHAIKFHSDFDPTGQSMDDLSLMEHSPVEQTLKQYLFRMVPMGTDPGIIMDLNNNGNMFTAVVASPFSLPISSIMLQKVPDSNDNLIAMNLDSYPFIFGASHHNIIPYVKKGWTSLYWPTIRYRALVDGRSSLSFDDNIYLFADDVTDE